MPVIINKNHAKKIRNKEDLEKEGYKCEGYTTINTIPFSNFEFYKFENKDKGSVIVSSDGIFVANFDYELIKIPEHECLAAQIQSAFVLSDFRERKIAPAAYNYLSSSCVVVSDTTQTIGGAVLWGISIANIPNINIYLIDNFGTKEAEFRKLTDGSLVTYGYQSETVSGDTIWGYEHPDPRIEDETGLKPSLKKSNEDVVLVAKR